MRCYYCDQATAAEAVGICAACGRAVCRTHSQVQSLPRYERMEAGPGGPFRRVRDIRRLVCQECGDTPAVRRA